MSCLGVSGKFPYLISRLDHCWFSALHAHTRAFGTQLHSKFRYKLSVPSGTRACTALVTRHFAEIGRLVLLIILHRASDKLFCKFSINIT